MATRKVIAKDAVPQKRLDVKVDDVAREVQLYRLGGNGEFACQPTGITAIIVENKTKHRQGPRFGGRSELALCPFTSVLRCSIYTIVPKSRNVYNL
jgi:hypothetical protein